MLQGKPKRLAEERKVPQEKCTASAPGKGKIGNSMGSKQVIEEQLEVRGRTQFRIALKMARFL
uniref:Uncharacterized protein n=1 Tax=Rhizophora mucronata TaxID=61149 RepID=A0A2P2IRS6_RHIMU